MTDSGNRLGYTSGMTLRERRIAAGLNMPQLGKLAGTTKQQIDKLESGERQFSVKWAKRLAPHLGVSWQVLLDEQTGSSSPALPSVSAGPAAGEFVKDPDELAVLAVWRNLLPDDRGDWFRFGKRLEATSPKRRGDAA